MTPEKPTGGGWMGPCLAAGGTFALHGLIALLAPAGTFRKYPLAAEQWLAGTLPRERLIDFSPLYFELNVLAKRWLTAAEPALHWIQIALVAVAAGFLFALLRRSFTPRLAAAAVAIMAFDRHLLTYERLLEPEAVMLFLLTGVLLFLQRDDVAWAGLFAGASLATRPTFLPVFLLVPLYLAWRKGARPIRPWLRASALFLLPVLLAFTWITWRAQSATGDRGTPVMNPGTVFFEGNNPLSRGTSALYPPSVLAFVRHSGEVPDSAHVHYRRLARVASGDPDLPVAEVNRFWSGHALAFLADHPGHASRLVLDKLLHAFHGFRWHDVPDAWAYDRNLRLPSVPFALLSALALLGLLAEARRWHQSVLFYALFATQLGVMLVFYVSARQRMVLLPALLFFATAAVAELLRGERRALRLALVAALALALSLPSAAMRDETYLRQSYADTDRRLNLVRQATRSAPLAQHQDLVIQALASGPRWLDWMRPAYLPQDDEGVEERVARELASRLDSVPPHALPSVRFDLADTLVRAGQGEQAEVLLLQLVDSGNSFYRGALQTSEPLHLLARAAALQGDRQRAVDLLERGLEQAPGNPFLLADLVALTDDPHHLQSLRTYWSVLDADWLLGQAMLFHGRPDAAEGVLRELVRRLPDFREARVLLAAALGEVGRIEEGAREMLMANKVRPEPVLETARIAELFRRWASLHPDDPRVQLLAARVLHQNGRFRDALKILDAAPPMPMDQAELASQVRQDLVAAATAPETPQG